MPNKTGHTGLPGGSATVRSGTRRHDLAKTGSRQSARQFGRYEAVAAARASRQLSDASWNRYLAEDDFAAWYLAEDLQR
jgi:hypothetical protein